MMAADQIALGRAGIAVAGGMESMSNAPLPPPQDTAGRAAWTRAGGRSMFRDWLEDAYDTGRPMGSFAEYCADRYGFSREAQDDFALSSLSRACAAQQCGAFAAEIAGVHLGGRQTDTILLDEQPGRARPDRIPTLRPAFREGGTITAANASSISDGAAALVIAAEQVARARGLTVRARIMGHVSPG